MDTKFDEKLDLMEKMQRGRGDTVLGSPTFSEVRDAAVFVIDTLDLCWVAAKSVFAEQANPAHAIDIYDRIQERLAESQLNVDQDDYDLDDEDEE